MLVTCGVQASVASDLEFAIQLSRPAAEVRAAFQPLTDYLGHAIGRSVQLAVPSSALTHWTALRSGEHPQLVLEEAHFIDYRVRRAAYRVLAKLQGVSGYSLVTGAGSVIIELEELYGKPVAALAAPSLGTLHLLRLFTRPVDAPIIVEAASYAQALRRMLRGDAVAALIASAMLADRPELNVVLSTEAGPNAGFAVSPAVDEATVARIRRALFGLGTTPAGRRALAKARIDAVVPARAEVFDGYARLLRGTWGFE